MADVQQIRQNLARQVELYGEPLGDYIRRISAGLRLTQARTAQVLGLSAPMLSQLMSGQRVKIGNPAVVRRLEALAELAEHSGEVADADLQTRLTEVQAMTSTVTRPRHVVAEQVDRDPASAVRGVLRAVASGRELVSAADLLADDHPGLAEVLRVYGTGTLDDARAHAGAISHLLR